uniref:Uncharacterized protein n=1 Tax=Chenopodium quinoa TaxID=63459 RepID=A0A803LQJ0_CHEQI
MMSIELRIGVEVEKQEEDGYYTKEAINKAISIVMNEQNEVAKEARANRVKWREFLLREGPCLEDSYISSFIESLKQLLV